MAFQTYSVPVKGAGALTLMPCPPAHELKDVLDRLCDQGVTAVLSMLPEAEAHTLGVGEEAALCAARGMTFLNHPIADFGLPDADQFAVLIADIKARMDHGQHIAVHCRAGIGRSGMVIAATLVAQGEQPDTAIAIASTARGVSIPDTVEQGNFIADFAQRAKKARR